MRLTEKITSSTPIENEKSDGPHQTQNTNPAQYKKHNLVPSDPLLNGLPKRPHSGSAMREIEQPSTLQSFKNAVQRTIRKPISKDEIQTAQLRSDAIIYKKVCSTIEERYKSFSQSREIGFGGKDGLVGDISDIKTRDLISILMHISSNENLRASALKKSATSALFDKIYLMENQEQGWNLRLHEFSPGGGAQGDEELPHFHRWTLASKILAGGYNNKNYEEIPAEDATADELLYRYQLQPSPAGALIRKLTADGQYGMRLIKETLFQEGDVRHFPVELPHSVSDISKHTGTTLTLAHTGKATKEISLAYGKQEGLISTPLDKPSTPERFIASLQNKIALLQLFSLRDALHRHLSEKDSKDLTEDEKIHLKDHSAPNYMETSLLPALGIFNLVHKNSETSSEFSSATEKFLHDKLRRINDTSLQELIESNQSHIENGHFSTAFSSWEQVEGAVEKAR